MFVFIFDAVEVFFHSSLISSFILTSVQVGLRWTWSAANEHQHSRRSQERGLLKRTEVKVRPPGGLKIPEEVLRDFEFYLWFFAEYVSVCRDCEAPQSRWLGLKVDWHPIWPISQIFNPNTWLLPSFQPPLPTIIFVVDNPPWSSHRVDLSTTHTLYLYSWV